MMSDNYSTNPKITFALIKLDDALNEQKVKPNEDYYRIVTHKQVVLDRYQPIFNTSYLAKLTKDEFESFLLIKNNQHWDSLHRVGKFITEDMPLLREALMILLDESRPISQRINEIRPERYWGEHSKVSHLGMPVLTAILQVMHPEKYGVWNNTSDAGLKIVKLWE